MSNEIKTLTDIFFAVQAFLVIAFIAQFISNMIIIFQLPKIKRLCEEMCYETEEDEEDKIQNS